MGSITDYANPRTWQELGFWGAVFAIAVGILIFSIVKNHVGFINIGPNEGGYRELFGITLWKLGPGPHFFVTGFTNVRKAPLARHQIDLIGQVPIGKKVKQPYVVTYDVSVITQVIPTKEALRALIYNTEDNDKTNMVNSENIKQVTSLFRRNLRKLIQAGRDEDAIEKKLSKRCKKKLETVYGRKTVEVLVNEIAIRPSSETALAIRSLGNNPLGPTIAAFLPEVTGHTGTERPHFDTIEGGANAG